MAKNKRLGVSVCVVVLDNYNDYCDCLYFEHKLYVQFRRSIRKNVRQIYIYNGNCRDAAGN